MQFFFISMFEVFILTTFIQIFPNNFVVKMYTMFILKNEARILCIFKFLKSCCNVTVYTIDFYKHFKFNFFMKYYIQTKNNTLNYFIVIRKIFFYGLGTFCFFCYIISYQYRYTPLYFNY